MGATSSFGNSNFHVKALAQGNQLTINDVTYEGVYGEYYFDTGVEEKNIEEHFFPKYSYGISYDPLTKEKQEWLQVGLHSKYDGDGIKKYKRLPLELVIVLDISGSMSSCFDYGEGDENKSKIEIAKSSLLSLFKHLQDNDKLGIITFNTEGQILHNLTPWKNTNAEELKKKIMTIRADGGTTLEIGLTLAGTLLESYNDGVTNSENNNNNIEKRILYFTDMDPGFNGKDSDNLLSIAEILSKKSIYCTFFGIGLDFNAKLVQHITKNLRGSHYMTIHNSLEFNSVMDENFSYTVFPILFDLTLKLIPSDPSLSIKQICGSREADQSTGELVKVKTIFPSAKNSNQTKGGVILIQLKRKNEENDYIDAINNEGNTIISKDNNDKINTNTTSIINTNTNDNVNIDNNNPNNSNNSNNNNNEIKLIVSYENRLTNQIENQEITFHIPTINDDNNNGYYEIDGMKKSVILSQYVDFVRKIIGINKNNENHKIVNDIELFTNYFKSQIDIIGDDTMKRELNVLDKLKQSFAPPVSQQQ